MKKLKGWDSYVKESLSKDDRSIELPLTDDEVYVIPYPSRKQGEAMVAAQKNGDVQALLVALLGPEAGDRVAELSADYPGYILDEFLLDVMRKFGFVDDTEDAPVVEAGKSSSVRPSRTGTRKRGTPRTNSSAA